MSREPGAEPRDRAFAPLRHPAFRRIWMASLLFNFGLLINGVGAGWAMTEMSGRPQDVALVQSALMLPYMLFAMAAGAIADTYDRRRVSMVMLLFSVAGAALLTATDLLGLLSPALLLFLCFLIGTANAMFAPAWQASVSEQVPVGELAQAVALNSVSYNLARSLGPAIGGVLVAAAGSVAAFAANGLCALPMLAALYFWRRVPDRPRLPPERIGWAITSGIRYVLNAPPMRTVVLRCAIFGVAGGAVSALMPLVARDLLGGSAAVYGVLLGAFGIGAVLGALLTGRLRRRLTAELHVGGSTAITGLSVLSLSFCRSEAAAILVLIVAGMSWMQVLVLFNVAIQTWAPRWVTGRALAAFQASIAGGVAVGSWLWGAVAQEMGTAAGIGLSGVALLACVPIGAWLRLPNEGVDPTERTDALGEPEVVLAITGRSGPVAIEIEYSVAPERARTFYQAMLEVARIRQRNGGYQWSLARDIAQEDRWIERFHCPTWHDYLRQRDRITAGEQAIVALALAETKEGAATHIRRSLERPIGSVRWTAGSADPGLILPVGSGSGTV